MADLSLNFSSQWPTVQVTQVIHDPQSTGIPFQGAYDRIHDHGLGFPPLAIAMSEAGSGEVEWPMEALDVDDHYVYVPQQPSNYSKIECIVIYDIDVSSDFTYGDYSSITSEPLIDTSRGTLDMRKFLLHSRSVGPMLMDVTTKNFSPGNTTLTYQSKLGYPSFVFGYVLWEDIWMAAPQQGQSYPTTNTDGYVTSVFADNPSQQTRGSIVALRNPAIITHNRVTANL